MRSVRWILLLVGVMMVVGWVAGWAMTGDDVGAVGSAGLMLAFASNMLGVFYYDHDDGDGSGQIPTRDLRDVTPRLPRW